MKSLLVVLLWTFSLQIQAENGHEITQKEKSMSITSSKVSSVLDLADPDYYHYDDALKAKLTQAYSDAITSQIPKDLPPMDPARKLAPISLSIGAPKHIDLQETQAFPLLIASSRSNLRRWEVNPISNLFFFARHHDTGKMLVLAPPLIDRKLPKPKKSSFGNPPDAMSASAFSFNVDYMAFFKSNAHQLVNGKWTVFALEHDTFSNHIHIDLSNAEESNEAKITQNQFMRYFQLKDPVNENRIKVMPTENNDVVMRIALNINPNIGLKTASDGQRKVVINFLILPLDDKAKVVNIEVPVNEFAIDNEPIYNTAFEVNLSAASEYKISNENTKVFIYNGAEFLEPIDVSFKGA